MAEERFVNVRKLAAFDLYFRRSRFILFEFGFVVFGLGGLGVLAVFFPPRHSLLAEVVGAYLILLGIDYLPMLVYGLRIPGREAARKEFAAELADEPRFRARYGLQQTLLMVPLVIPVLAVWQEIGRPRNHWQT